MPNVNEYINSSKGTPNTRTPESAAKFHNLRDSGKIANEKEQDKVKTHEQHAT
jgi:hypothetical protein